MRRYTFYLAVALLAFGIGSFVVFKSYWKTDGKQIITGEKQVANKTRSPKNFGTGTGYAIANKQIDKPAYVPKLTCSNEKLLPVWRELKKDKEFRERAKEFYMNADCSIMLDIQEIDLNNDGRKEFILWGNNGNLCGGHYACDVWVYEKRNGVYKRLLQSSAYNDGTNKWFEIGKVKNNGYKNFILKGESSGNNTTIRFYEFDGEVYKDIKCLFKVIFSMKKCLR